MPARDLHLQVTADEAARRIPNTDSRPMFKNLETARKTIVERIPATMRLQRIMQSTPGAR